MRCPFTPVEMARYRRTGLLRPTCPCPLDPECDCSVAAAFDMDHAADAEGWFGEWDGADVD